MTGPVDFHRDMDFWQQDKWSGSFPVKWHIIKDLPNPNFRHIILENNENKPVTNSRDTQEVFIAVFSWFYVFVMHLLLKPTTVYASRYMESPTDEENTLVACFFFGLSSRCNLSCQTLRSSKLFIC